MTAYFCDGLKDVTIVNGIVRLELQRLEPLGRSGDTRSVSELFIAMPLQGLLNMFGAFSKIRDDLVREGILKSEPVSRSPNPAVAAEVSPNFL